ncbi:hypothetical protein Poli38472_010321 [Pythium oligandrum]|uniref:Uncharacterized protein n=1 Tax=Pythium oligandrum TaxID=41045 RepID=A0A8K1FC36_PYTOL|nr:hypothetical protein Poli38472_010321 [Pythium oligandrum]|eukprot:TMW55439.1 hypothetical protein Poli38472_010321 [Pythium oligandrum]
MTLLLRVLLAVALALSVARADTELCAVESCQYKDGSVCDRLTQSCPVCVYFDESQDMYLCRNKQKSTLACPTDYLECPKGPVGSSATASGSSETTTSGTSSGASGATPDTPASASGASTPSSSLPATLTPSGGASSSTGTNETAEANAAKKNAAGAGGGFPSWAIIVMGVTVGAVCGLIGAVMFNRRRKLAMAQQNENTPFDEQNYTYSKRDFTPSNTHNSKYGNTNSPGFGRQDPHASFHPSDDDYTFDNLSMSVPTVPAQDHQSAPRPAPQSAPQKYEPAGQPRQAPRDGVVPVPPLHNRPQPRDGQLASFGRPNSSIPQPPGSQQSGMSRPGPGGWGASVPGGGPAVPTRTAKAQSRDSWDLNTNDFATNAFATNNFETMRQKSDSNDSADFTNTNTAWLDTNYIQANYLDVDELRTTNGPASGSAPAGPKRPKSAAPSSSYPDTSYPDTSYPDTSYPDTSYPDTSYPDTSKSKYPDTSYPDTSYPDTSKSKYPDTSYPDTSYPDTSYPNTSYPDTTYPDTTYPDTTYPDTTYPDTTYPDTTLNTSRFVADMDTQRTRDTATFDDEVIVDLSRRDNGSLLSPKGRKKDQQERVAKFKDRYYMEL